jgi:hypothetical protein
MTSLLNDLQRYETWEACESALNTMIFSGAVLDYKRRGDHVEVVIDGLAQPLKIPLRDDQSSSVRLERQSPTSPMAQQEQYHMTLNGVMVDYRSHIQAVIAHALLELGVGDREDAVRTSKSWIKMLPERIRKQ